VGGGPRQPDPGAGGRCRCTHQESTPATAPFFEDAYGFAVWPSIVRAAAGFDAAYGKGLVVEDDVAVGTTGYWQFTSGIQAGAKSFAMIIFFQDEEAFEYCQEGKFHFMGQAGIDVFTAGAHATPGYEGSVAVFVVTGFGLMGEFSYSGVKFTYRPLPAPRGG
jgi:lipid-binding SYLF domain-containing protein